MIAEHIEVTQLPKYGQGTAKGNRCVKCDVAFDGFHHTKSTSYCKGAMICSLGAISDEHMHRTCNNCGYVWGERTSDAG